ncbi:hypothetical protein ACIGHG_25575 [Bacillus sp. NPDC077411]|uniref:hypothetical protein n=1 Tax=Bacillus sp. NPDC077411 TaxID=3363947 RepID=UPI0037CCB7DD
MMMFKKLKMSVVAFVMPLSVLFGFVHVPSASAENNDPVSLNFKDTYYHEASEFRYYLAGEIIQFKVTRSGGNRDTRTLHFWIEDKASKKIPGTNVYLQKSSYFPTKGQYNKVYAPANGYYRIHMRCYKTGSPDYNNAGCAGTGWMDDVEE